MDRQHAGVAEIFRCAGSAYRERMAGRLDAGRLKVMAAIEACRTAVLGGHMYACDGCGREHPLYNSCRNRHCPTCQGLAANRWSEARADDILPVPYFHVVFTLPKEIAAIAFCNRRVVFDILFKTVAETLRTIAADPRHAGLRIGGNRRPPYVGPEAPLPSPSACGGAERGLRRRERRVEDGERHLAGSGQGPRQLLPPPLSSKTSPAPMAAASWSSTAPSPISPIPASFHAVLAAARSRDWVVYAKRPFRGPEQVFRYLARYTHRIAISDSRITAFDGGDRLLPAPKAERAGGGEAALRHHDRPRRRVHPPLSAPCPARWDAPHPSLRHPLQRLPCQGRWRELARRSAPSAAPTMRVWLTRRPKANVNANKNWSPEPLP